MNRKLIEKNLKRLDERIGFLKDERNYAAMFVLQNKEICPSVFSLAEAIQAIIDHLGMELAVKPKEKEKVILVKKTKKPQRPTGGYFRIGD